MNARTNIVITITAFLVLLSSTAKAADRQDTMLVYEDSPCVIKPKQLILPGALIAIGASSFFISSVRDFDHRMQEEIMDIRGDNHRIKLDEYLRFLPTATSITLGLAKQKSRLSSTDSFLASITSIATAYFVTQGIKHTVKRTRPDGSDNHSFPSGHVVSVFQSAEMLRIEYGNWWGALGYTAATGVAYLRMYNNRHWFSDVIGGVGVAILTARVSYWLVPFEKKIFGISDKKDSSSTRLVALPTYFNQNNSLGLALSLQF